MAKYLADFRQGDTVKIRIEYPAGTDLTGYKWWLTLKAQFEDTDAAAVLQHSAVSDDTVIDDGVNTQFYLVIPKDKTAAVPDGKYFYDVQEMSGNGEIRTLAPPVDEYKDKVTVRPGPTQASE